MCSDSTFRKHEKQNFLSYKKEKKQSINGKEVRKFFLTNQKGRMKFNQKQTINNQQIFGGCDDEFLVQLNVFSWEKKEEQNRITRSGRGFTQYMCWQTE